MSALGLSDAQLAERRTRLHAGDAAAIMAGDYRRVFRRIKGLDAEDDLSGEFRVQLGSFTEPFNLAWTMRQTGREIVYYSANALMRECWDALVYGYMRDGDIEPPLALHDELAVSKRYPWMACNLDSMTTTPQGHRCPLDAKHVSSAGEQAILRYTPPGVWQATVTGCDWWGISWIVGNKWVGPDYQEVDPMYQEEMIRRASECWGYIERDEEPPEAEAAPVLPPKPQPKLRSIIVPTDDPDVYAALCRSNNWIGDAKKHVEAIIGTDAAAKVWAIHREDMKTLVPEDVGEFVWGRYRLARSRAGAVTQTVQKMEADNG